MGSSKKYVREAFALCAAAAVLYNSWPLGYLLDRKTASHELASSLERAGHPYYWIFLMADLLTAAAIVAVAAIVRLRLWPALRSGVWSVVCSGLFLFGVFTAISALVPARCVAGASLRCGSGGLGLGLDAFTSVIAALGLFAALAALSASRVRYGTGGTLKLKLATHLILLFWSVSGVAFIALALSGGRPNLAQDIQLALTGVAIIILGMNVKYDASKP